MYPFSLFYFDEASADLSFFIVNLVINRPIYKMRFLRFGPTTKDFINREGLDSRELG